MIKAGEKAVINIDAIATGGDGVGRLDGIAVFVPHTCRGDRVEIELSKVKSGCAYGNITKIIEPSPYRRADFCASLGACGGCDLAHMEYAEQLFVKRQIVVDTLSRIGGFTDITVNETLPAPRPERYRNKMVFPLGRDENGKPSGGFFATKSHKLVPLTDCRQGDRIASLWLAATLDYITETHTTLYDENSRRGAARRLFVRLAEGTKEAMIVLTANAKKIKQPELFVEKILAVPTDYTVKSIILNVHQEPNNLLLGTKNKVLYGTETIEDILGGLRFSISPHSFYQINAPQTENLYNTALSLAGLSGTETVLDLYCGIGTISLFAARKAAKVLGVEIVPQAIENAKENAARNGITNAEFLLGSAEEIAPRLAKEGNAPDVVFVDPPRKGCDEAALSAVLQMNPKKIVYVSCNPATLARDAKFLCQHGYTLQEATPADMFPNTSHIEAVILLQRDN